MNSYSFSVAQYVEDKDGKEKVPVYSYYAGVVAEAPKYLNLYRYLIFFDDGYAQYCTHDQVFLPFHFLHTKVTDFLLFRLSWCATVRVTFGMIFTQTRDRLFPTI